MNYLPFTLFVIVPLLFAATSSLWFWRLRYFNKLKKDAPIIDSQEVAVPVSPVPIKALRMANQIGDKTVITHHLLDVAEDLEDDIQTTILLVTLLNVALILFVAVILETKDSQQQVSTGMWETIKHVLDRVPVFYFTPVSEFVGALYASIAIIFLRKQVRKYRSVMP